MEVKFQHLVLAAMLFGTALGFMRPIAEVFGGILLLGTTVFFPLTVIAAYGSGWAEMKKRQVHWISALVRLLVLMTIGMVSAIAAGWSNFAYQTSITRQYVEHAVPILDEIKNRDGQYPLTLPTTLLGTPPRFLRNPNAYFSNGREYRFSYSAFMETYGFENLKRQWVVEVD